MHTQSLPLDQNSPGNLWMHQSMPRVWAVHSQLPLAAVKSQCLSEVECNQNSVSSCFIRRHLLWAVFWFTAALHSARSVQRGNKHPAVCTKESQPAALGLFDTSLQATSKEERSGCDCSLKYSWAFEFKGRSSLALCSWKVLEGADEIHWGALKQSSPFWGSDGATFSYIWQ